MIAETIVPDGKPLMRRRELRELGLSACVIRKLEESGALTRVYPIKNGHGYYIRKQVKLVILGGGSKEEQ